jgi:hypothetical protein
MANPTLANDPGRRPWTVVVRDGVVVARYRAEDSYVTDGKVTLTSFGDGPVTVFVVDDRLPEPPNIGEPADPVTLGWLPMGGTRHDRTQAHPTADE